MNANAQIYSQYKKTSVETSSPGKLLLMLYNACITDVEEAQGFIKEKDFDNAHKQIIKAQSIVVELMSTLNMDYAISGNLYSLYDFIYSQMVEANLKKDADILDQVRDLLIELRDTWQEAIKLAGSTASRQPASDKNLNITG